MNDPTLVPDAEETAKKQRGQPFQPGQSGNPHGRPKGSRNKTTLLAEALLEGESKHYSESHREGFDRRSGGVAIVRRTVATTSAWSAGCVRFAGHQKRR